MKIRPAMSAVLLGLLPGALGCQLAQGQDAAAPEASPGMLSPQPEPAKLPAAKIDELTGPIALYPDPLIAQILPAATYPTDIVIAARLVSRGATPEQIAAQEWDSSVRALVNYPSILKMMDERLDWTQQLGAAFLRQPDDVMDSVQRLRVKARDLGHLNDTPEQRVIVENDQPETTVVRIVPATTEVVYVPQYNPQVVYVDRYDPVVPIVAFTAGFAIGAWLDLDCDWYGRRCYYPSGWNWSTCYSPSYSYYWPGLRSSWYWGNPWCGGPTWSVSWTYGHGYYNHGYYGHGYYGGGYHGHHGHYDNYYSKPYGRTSDVYVRGGGRDRYDDGYARSSGYSRSMADTRSTGRSDDTWSRNASRPSLHAGSKYVGRDSDLYKRSVAGERTGDRLSIDRPQTRTSDSIKRDLSRRSFNPPSKIETPGGRTSTGSRSNDSLKRDSSISVPGNTRSTTPATRSTAPTSRSNGITAPGQTRDTPSTRSSGGLTVPKTTVRTVRPSDTRSTAPTTRSTAPTTRNAPATRSSSPSQGRQGLSRSPSSSRPSASPSRTSSPSRSASPSRSSGGSSGGSKGTTPGNRRSK